MAGPYNFRPSAARRMFSSMFHPPSVHTHAPYRFSPLSRPQFVCINAQPRDRSTPPGNEEAEKPGKFRSAGKRCVPRRKGAKGVAREFSRHRYLDACISFPFPLVFMDGTTVPQRREGADKGEGNGFSTGREIVSRRNRASAVNFFTRSLLVSAPRRGFKESGRFVSSPRPSFSFSYRWRDDYFRGATVNGREGMKQPVTRSKVNSKHVNDFQEGSPALRAHVPPSIRNSRDHRFEERSLSAAPRRGLRDFPRNLCSLEPSRWASN